MEHLFLKRVFFIYFVAKLGIDIFAYRLAKYIASYQVDFYARELKQYGTDC